MDARVLSITLGKNWREVYGAIWRPEDFAKWASGLSAAALTRDGDVWKGEGPEGPITVRFTPHNDFGILDHTVDTGTGLEVYIPIRIIANGEGCDVQLTLFRQPHMSDGQYEADAQWVQRDLDTLAELFAPGS